MEGVDKDAIVGVGLTTQRSTLINLDKNQQPLRPAVVWLDQRRTEGLPPVGGVWGLLFKLAGMSETVRYFQAEAEGTTVEQIIQEIIHNVDSTLQDSKSREQIAKVLRS